MEYKFTKDNFETEVLKSDKRAERLLRRLVRPLPHDGSGC